MFFMFMSSGVCNSVRSVDLVGGAAWELAHKDATTNKDTLACMAYKRQKGFVGFFLNNNR